MPRPTPRRAQGRCTSPTKAGRSRPRCGTATRWRPASASRARPCSRKTKAPSSSAPAPRRACWPTVRSWRSRVMAEPKKMREFDPIELELLWRRLISMVDEAAAAMVRTSFSTLVRESYDFSCVITDAAGQSLVQASESIPSFIGTLPETVKHFLRFFPPDQLAPGDVLITNDIWLGTGHLPDITLAKPIFKDGQLVAFSATTAHAPDIGGKIRSPETPEEFEEGLQIPPMKMIAAGKTD